MKCYACGNEAVVLFEYTSSLSRTCREARCQVCADALRESENTIHEEIQLKETDEDTSSRPTPQTRRRPKPPHMLTGGSRS